MKITILTTDSTHPVFSYLENWSKKYKDVHQIAIKSTSNELTGGDILFLISCHEYVDKILRDKYRYSLVIHASDLPFGRGWSPLVWQILDGKTDITVSLIEAGETVDSGDVWSKKMIHVEGHELYNEINENLFEIECDLMDFAINNHDKIVPLKQDESESSYYRRRYPEDSKLNPHETIAEQFDILRISDPARYPAYFEYRGYRYNLLIEKIRPIEK
jgi:methionyl-tRNA formyltransferase